MAYLRCSSCGAKALRIATRCPSCGSAIQLRDARGQRLRLRRCRGCDIHVPREDPVCPWCQTEPRDLPWRAAAVVAAALILVGGGVFLLAGGPLAGPSAGMEPDPLPEPSLQALRSPPPAEDLPVEAPSYPLPEAPWEAEARSRSIALEGAVPEPADSPGGEAPEGAADQWSPAEAVTFVNVRADPDRHADILGVVPESATVLLGDLRGGWRRVRAGDLSGWVDGRLFRMASSGE